jgi:hypothetical protein
MAASGAGKAPSVLPLRAKSAAALRCVALRMMIRKKKIITTSQTKGIHPPPPIVMGRSVERIT